MWVVENVIRKGGDGDGGEEAENVRIPSYGERGLKLLKKLHMIFERPLMLVRNSLQSTVMLTCWYTMIRCPGSSVRTTQCQATESMSVIANKCNGKNSCVIEASNTVFGNPCEGTSKYVEILYLCETQSRRPRVVICEGQSASIGCTNGKVIKIKKAVYGRQDWTT